PPLSPLLPYPTLFRSRQLPGQRVRAGPLPAARFHGHVQQQLVPGGTRRLRLLVQLGGVGQEGQGERRRQPVERRRGAPVHAQIVDRKSTRLNSSHVKI